ncbi:MAG: hypothetical protein R3C32_14610 [Chloroflexota bacterium]
MDRVDIAEREVLGRWGGAGAGSGAGAARAPARALGGGAGAGSGGDPRAALEAERVSLVLARRIDRHGFIMTNTMNVTEDAIRTGEWAWVMMLADELPEEDLERRDRAIGCRCPRGHRPG